jgi:hypothetical protein
VSTSFFPLGVQPTQTCGKHGLQEQVREGKSNGTFKEGSGANVGRYVLLSTDVLSIFVISRPDVRHLSYALACHERHNITSLLNSMSANLLTPTL